MAGGATLHLTATVIICQSCNNTIWWQVVLHGGRWCYMVAGGAPWWHVVLHGGRWCYMVVGGAAWWEVMLNGGRQLYML